MIFVRQEKDVFEFMASDPKGHFHGTPICPYKKNSWTTGNH